MSRVFINYRTDDEEGSATLIEHELSRRFGSEEIFRASKSIDPGDNFERVILRAVRRSDVLLAIIGPRWLTVRDGQKRRKIDLESDWTRREILEAFRCDLRVIPVLIGRAERLRTKSLPAELAPLARCQYVRFDHRRAAADLALLADTIARLVPDLEDRTASGRESSGASATPEPPMGGTIVTNNATGNARIGVQGVVNGDITFGREP